MALVTREMIWRLNVRYLANGMHSRASTNQLPMPLPYRLSYCSA